MTAATCGGSHSKRAAPPAASTRGRSATQRRITPSPSAPATTATRGSNASELRSPTHRSTDASGRYGRFAQTSSTRSVTGASRSPWRSSTRSATPFASALDSATASASREESVAMTRTRCSCAATATAIAPETGADVHDGHSASSNELARRVNQHLGLGPRDEHARVDAKAKAVELLESTQVRDGLPAAPSVDECLESRLLVRGELALGVREQRFLSDAENVRQQDVGIERRGARVGRGPQARRRRGARLATRRHPRSIVAS